MKGLKTVLQRSELPECGGSEEWPRGKSQAQTRESGCFSSDMLKQVATRVRPEIFRNDRWRYCDATSINPEA